MASQLTAWMYHPMSVVEDKPDVMQTSRIVR